MARKKATRGEKAARTRARNKKLAAQAAAQAQQNEIALAQEQEYERTQELERVTSARIDSAYKLGLNDGRIQGYDRGFSEGYDTAKRQLRDSAANLAERQTELGSVATVIDSMAAVTNAGAQALTTYFGDKRNGPNANALMAIDEKIAGLPTPKQDVTNGTRRHEMAIPMRDIMAMLTGAQG